MADQLEARPFQEQPDAPGRESPVFLVLHPALQLIRVVPPANPVTEVPDPGGNHRNQDSPPGPEHAGTLAQSLFPSCNVVQAGEHGETVKTCVFEWKIRAVAPNIDLRIRMNVGAHAFSVSAREEIVAAGHIQQLPPAMGEGRADALMIDGRETETAGRDLIKPHIQREEEVIFQSLPRSGDRLEEWDHQRGSDGMTRRADGVRRRTLRRRLHRKNAQKPRPAFMKTSRMPVCER